MSEIRAFAPKSRELVVHSKEWTTGYPEKVRNQAKTPKYRELVVHSSEWTTSSTRIYLFMRPAPCSLSQNTKEALPFEWQGCLLLTGLFAVLGVGDPDAGYD